MSETPILVRGLVKSFGRRRALDGIDLEVPRGCVLGLLGKNGAGKTTLLKCLLGLLRPDAGSAALFGEEAWSLGTEGKARVGYVPQVVTLYPWMRIRQLMAYTAPFYPRWNAARVADLLRCFELDPEARVKALSVGTLKKLAIILALGHEPTLLILDEPAASLDPAARRQFLKAILDIAMDEKRVMTFCHPLLAIPAGFIVLITPLVPAITQYVEIDQAAPVHAGEWVIGLAAAGIILTVGAYRHWLGAELG